MTESSAAGGSSPRSAALPAPPRDPEATATWVADHLGDLAREGARGVRPSPSFRGGQSAADAALAAFDVTGYARRRSEVWPDSRRGASRMSPYVRHGLVDLPTLWQAVAEAPRADRETYRDELLWQEYARHVYARVGRRSAAALRYQPPAAAPAARRFRADAWPRDMACVDLAAGELERDGWLVNQTRMWLASQWTVRAGWDWRDGEEEFFAHLLDGSRAANRLGWQWTVGAGTGKPYGFSRWQVRKRAPGLCDRCALRDDCPIDAWPDEAATPSPVEPPPQQLRRDPDPARTAGPASPVATSDPDCVWLTFESLGDADPALAAHPDLPVVAVFDAALLARLRLSGKRLVFLAETLADLAARRDVEVHRGDPAVVLSGRRPAVTHAPVPGFARLSRRVPPAVVHPWRWLVRPGGGPATSFTAWRRALRT